LIKLDLSFLHITILTVGVLDTSKVLNLIIFFLLVKLIFLGSDSCIISHSTLVVFLFVSFKLCKTLLLLLVGASSCIILLSFKILSSLLLAGGAASSLLLNLFFLLLSFHLVPSVEIDTRVRFLYFILSSLHSLLFLTIDVPLFLLSLGSTAFQSLDTVVHGINLLLGLLDIGLKHSHVLTVLHVGSLLGLVNSFELPTVTIPNTWTFS